MFSVIHDTAAIEHDNGVRCDERGQTVRHHDHGSPLGNTGKVCLDDRLALRIKRGGRLVQDENARLAQQGAGDRQALLLADRLVPPSSSQVS